MGFLGNFVLNSPFPTLAAFSPFSNYLSIFRYVHILRAVFACFATDWSCLSLRTKKNQLGKLFSVLILDPFPLVLGKQRAVHREWEGRCSFLCRSGRNYTQNYIKFLDLVVLFSFTDIHLVIVNNWTLQYADVSSLARNSVFWMSLQWKIYHLYFSLCLERYKILNLKRFAIFGEEQSI